MTPRVVYDTNIIISAALGARPIESLVGRPSLCLRLALSGAAVLVASTELLEEYEEVLRRPKFAFPPRRIRAFMTLLYRHAELVQPIRIPPKVVEDPDDAPVLGTAVAGRAQFLVTGNQRDFPKLYRGVRVVSPAEFLATVVDVQTD